MEDLRKKRNHYKETRGAVLKNSLQDSHQLIDQMEQPLGQMLSKPFKPQGEGKQGPSQLGSGLGSAMTSPFNPKYLIGTSGQTSANPPEDPAVQQIAEAPKSFPEQIANKSVSRSRKKDLISNEAPFVSLQPGTRSRKGGDLQESKKSLPQFSSKDKQELNDKMAKLQSQLPEPLQTRSPSIKADSLEQTLEHKSSTKKPLPRERIKSLNKLVPFKIDPPPQPFAQKEGEEGWQGLSLAKQSSHKRGQSLFVPKNPRKFKKSPQQKKKEETKSNLPSSNKKDGRVSDSHNPIQSVDSDSGMKKAPFTFASSAVKSGAKSPRMEGLIQIKEEHPADLGSSNMMTKPEESVPKILPIPTDSGSPKDFFQNMMKSDGHPEESLRELKEVAKSSFSSEEEHKIIDELFEQPIEQRQTEQEPIPASSNKRKIENLISEPNSSISREVYKLPSEQIHKNHTPTKSTFQLLDADSNVIPARQPVSSEKDRKQPSRHSINKPSKSLVPSIEIIRGSKKSESPIMSQLQQVPSDPEDGQGSHQEHESPQEKQPTAPLEAVSRKEVVTQPLIEPSEDHKSMAKEAIQDSPIEAQDPEEAVEPMLLDGSEPNFEFKFQEKVVNYIIEQEEYKKQQAELKKQKEELQNEVEQRKQEFEKQQQDLENLQSMIKAHQDQLQKMQSGDKMLKKPGPVTFFKEGRLHLEPDGKMISQGRFNRFIERQKKFVKKKEQKIGKLKDELQEREESTLRNKPDVEVSKQSLQQSSQTVDHPRTFDQFIKDQQRFLNGVDSKRKAGELLKQQNDPWNQVYTLMSNKSRKILRESSKGANRSDPPKRSTSKKHSAKSSISEQPHIPIQEEAEQPKPRQEEQQKEQDTLQNDSPESSNKFSTFSSDSIDEDLMDELLEDTRGRDGGANALNAGPTGGVTDGTANKLGSTFENSPYKPEAQANALVQPSHFGIKQPGKSSSTSNPVFENQRINIMSRTNAMVPSGSHSGVPSLKIPGTSSIQPSQANMLPTSGRLPQLNKGGLAAFDSVDRPPSSAMPGGFPERKVEVQVEVTDPDDSFSSSEPSETIEKSDAKVQPIAPKLEVLEIPEEEKPPPKTEVKPAPMIRGYMEPTKSGQQKVTMKLKDALVEHNKKSARDSASAMRLTKVDSKSSKSFIGVKPSSRSASYMAVRSRSKDESVRLNNPNSYANQKKASPIKTTKAGKTSNKLMLQKFNKEFMTALKNILQVEQLPATMDSYVFSRLMVRLGCASDSDFQNDKSKVFKLIEEVWLCLIKSSKHPLQKKAIQDQLIYVGDVKVILMAILGIQGNPRVGAEDAGKMSEQAEAHPEAQLPFGWLNEQGQLCLSKDCVADLNQRFQLLNSNRIIFQGEILNKKKKDAQEKAGLDFKPKMMAQRKTEKILKRRREQQEESEERPTLRAKSVAKNYDLYIRYKQSWRRTEKYNKEKEELDKCTFQPQINSKGKAVTFVPKTLKGVASVDTLPKEEPLSMTERILRNKLSRDGPKEAESKPEKVNLKAMSRFDQLYSLGKLKAKQSKEEPKETWEERQFKSQEEECTFKPKMVAKFKAEHHIPKWKAVTVNEIFDFYKSQELADQIRQEEIQAKIREDRAKAKEKVEKLREDSQQKLIDRFAAAQKHRQEMQKLQDEGKFKREPSMETSKQDSHRVVQDTVKRLNYNKHSDHIYERPPSMKKLKEAKKKEQEAKKRIKEAFGPIHLKKMDILEHDHSEEAQSLKRILDHKVGRKERQPIIHLDIDIGQGQQERLTVFSGDNVGEVTRSFCEKYGFDPQQAEELRSQIENNVTYLENVRTREQPPAQLPSEPVEEEKKDGASQDEEEKQQPPPLPQEAPARQATPSDLPSSYYQEAGGQQISQNGEQETQRSHIREGQRSLIDSGGKSVDFDRESEA